MRHLIMKALLPLAIVLVLVMNMRPIEASRVLNEDHAYRLLLTTMQKGSDTPSAPNLPDNPWRDTPSSPNSPFIPLSKGSDTPSAPNVPISPASSIPKHFTGHAMPPPRP
ncbi:hypothetical protein L484_001405 [Morus notabilis]|uniref:Uncharacterized protein n=1 Tax=Morus notabilis TaxID=981085 RepID=W9STH8_9ROSA|nr:hypothetical protein L484_001405 [Morus notabilis]